MGDVVPINGVMTGPRALSLGIRSSRRRCVWVEALDKGDIRNKVPHRDRIVTLAAPFTGEPTEVAQDASSASAARAGPTTGTILLTENDRATRTTRTWVLDAELERAAQAVGSQAAGRLRAIRARRCSGPARARSCRSATAIYLTRPGRVARRATGRSSIGSNLEDARDRAPLPQRRRRATRRSSALLDDDATKVLTRYETRTEPPNYFVRDLPAAPRSRRSPTFKDPHPQITARRTQLVTYKRKDGVGLSGTIYLPPGYKKGERLPMLVWAYPREFADADAASQVVGSPNRFTTVGGASHLLLLTQGYAIFDGPTMPIVGPGETANDTYVEQLVGERRRRRSTRPSSWASPTATASASAATATARS